MSEWVMKSGGHWLLMVLLVLGGSVARADSSSNIRINGKPMTAGQQQEYAQTYGSYPVAGDYWYDAKTGLYGIMGGGFMGSMNPGHDFGTLPAGASNGDTGVFINGRELPAAEVAFFAALVGQLQPGRYWMDAAGNWGREPASETSAQQPAAKVEPKSTPPAPKPKPRAPVATADDPRLVGVYKGETIAGGDTGTYTNTQLNWVFQPDGTVLYGAISHYSASERDYNGDLEWTATGNTGETADRGRWSAADGILTIQWDSGERSRFAYSFYDGMLVYRNPQTRKLINYYPRIK